MKIIIYNKQICLHINFLSSPNTLSFFYIPIKQEYVYLYHQTAYSLISKEHIFYYVKYRPKKYALKREKQIF